MALAVGVASNTSLPGQTGQVTPSELLLGLPLLAKVPTVKGTEQVPLYKYLTSKETDPKFAGDIKWNFTKFLVDRNGNVVQRFEPAVTPDSAEMVAAVEKQLK